MLDGIVRSSQLSMHRVHCVMQLPRIGDVVMPRWLIVPAKQPVIVVEGHRVGPRDRVVQPAPMVHTHRWDIGHDQQRRTECTHLACEAAQEGTVRLNVAKARELGLVERDREHIPRL